MAWHDWAARVKRRLFLSHLVPYLSEEFRRQQRRVELLERRVRLMQEALGRIELRQLAGVAADGDLDSHEFRVFSQWGEDGIIDFLCRRVPVTRKLFVEFGVENYEESNTRFLLVNRNWSGLVIDGDPAQVDQIRASRLHWLYDLRPVAAFVTRDNINQVLSDHGATGDIGLLSIDIDGMDWWVWEAIEVARPAIVVVEYNYRFGPDESVVVPYAADFDRRKAHPSILYYGASLTALSRLGRRKGYALVGCGSAGLNAFFVRRDLRPESIPERSPGEAFVEGRFCEAHDDDGRRIRMDNAAQRRLVLGMPLVRVDGDGVAR